MTRAGRARRVLDAGLEQADPRVSREGTGDPLKRVVGGEARVVVEEEDELAADVRHAGVAPRGRSHVLGQGQPAHARRQSGRRPPVADDHDVDLDIALAQE